MNASAYFSAAVNARSARDGEGQLCGIRRFNFTSAVVVGVDPVGYRRRYCYEHAHEARQALAAWDGKGHPGGPWIKCTGAGIELLNPALTC